MGLKTGTPPPMNMIHIMGVCFNDIHHWIIMAYKGGDIPVFSHMSRVDSDLT